MEKYSKKSFSHDFANQILFHKRTTEGGIRRDVPFRVWKKLDFAMLRRNISHNALWDLGQSPRFLTAKRGASVGMPPFFGYRENL